MKKFILVGALVLATAGSWAFYPKTTEPSGYMTVIGRIDYFTRTYSLLLIPPDGQVQEQTTQLTSKSAKTARVDSKVTEVVKLNQLRLAGWRIISTYSTVEANYSGGGSSAFSTTYVLEK